MNPTCNFVEKEMSHLVYAIRAIPEEENDDHEGELLLSKTKHRISPIIWELLSDRNKFAYLSRKRILEKNSDYKIFGLNDTPCGEVLNKIDPKHIFDESYETFIKDVFISPENLAILTRNSSIEDLQKLMATSPEGWPKVNWDEKINEEKNALWLKYLEITNPAENEKSSFSDFIGNFRPETTNQKGFMPNKARKSKPIKRKAPQSLMPKRGLNLSAPKTGNNSDNSPQGGENNTEKKIEGFERYFTPN